MGYGHSPDAAVPPVKCEGCLLTDCPKKCIELITPARVIDEIKKCDFL